MKSIVARDSLTFSGGTLIGATVLGSAVTVLPGASVTLDGVTLAADLMVQDDARVLALNGLTLADATVTLADTSSNTVTGTRLEFEGTQTLGGTGAVVFAGTTLYHFVRASSGTLTLGAGLTIQGNASGTVGNGTLALINQGTLVAAAGQQITVTGIEVRNSGLLEARNGGILVVHNLVEEGSGTTIVGPGSSGTVNGQTVEPSVPVMLGSVQVQVTGATIITHGFQPFDTDGDSLWSLADAIRFRADTENGATESAWLLDYDLVADGGMGIFDDAFGDDPSILPGLSDAGRKGEVVFLFDWAPESNQASSGWGEAAGDALFALLVDLGVVNPSGGGNNIPLHFIGHSFGTAVTSEAVERLARFNVPVDHLTYLDPHDFDQPNLPIDENQRLFDLGQPDGYGASVWNIVEFADVYYEIRGSNEGSLLPDSIVPLGRPIPGAYNLLLADNGALPDVNGNPVDGPYSPGEGAGDHGYVWNTFYHGTVEGHLPAGQPAPEDSSSFNFSQTGFAFSRIADGETLRPAEGRNLAQNARWSPEWDSLTIVNGNFEHRGEGNVFIPDWVPGWSHHGGGGTGDVDEELIGSNHYLRLDNDQADRTHNSLYVPMTASYLAFDLQRVDASADDVLAVRFGESDPLVAICLATADSDSIPYVIPLPTGLRNQVDTFTFALVQGGTGIEAQVYIDNVKFLSTLDGVPFAPSFCDVRVSNRVDQDGDSYASQLDLEFDVDLNGVAGEYYLKVYEDDPLFDDLLLTSPSFPVSGSAQDYQLVTIVNDQFLDVLNHGTAEFRIDIYDSATDRLVMTWTASNDPDLGNVRVELSSEDQPVSASSAGSTLAPASVENEPESAVANNLSLAYVQQSWLEDFVAGDSAAVEEDEELLIALPG